MVYVVIKCGMFRSCRTEHAKHVRRIYGDGSGMCRFSDKFFRIADDGVSNTLTASGGIDKFNFLAFEYDYL